MAQNLSTPDTDPATDPEQPSTAMPATWPAAVDVEPYELSVRHADVIFVAAEYPNASNSDLADRVGVDPSCVSRTLCTYWPERAPGSPAENPELTPDEVDTARQQLLNDPEASVTSLADDLPIERPTLGDYVRGECKHVEPATTTPPLRWNTKVQQWEPATGTNTTNTGPGPAPALTADEIDTVRMRLLAGDTIPDIMDDFEISKSTVRRHAVKETTREGTDVPPVTYDGSNWTLDSEHIPTFAKAVLDNSNLLDNI